MTDRPALPQRPPRTPQTHQVAHRSGSPAFALLIRVATGLDQWAELDQVAPRTWADRVRMFLDGSEAGRGVTNEPRNLLQENDSGRNQ
jgi:hypothetical protein